MPVTTSNVRFSLEFLELAQPKATQSAVHNGYRTTINSTAADASDLSGFSAAQTVFCGAMANILELCSATLYHKLIYGEQHSPLGAITRQQGIWTVLLWACWHLATPDS
jgi:hypothetical protein